MFFVAVFIIGLAAGAGPEKTGAFIDSVKNKTSEISKSVQTKSAEVGQSARSKAIEIKEKIKKSY